MDDNFLYERRRADARMDRIESKIDGLSRLVYMGLGIVMVLSMIMNVLGPIIAASVTKGQ